MNWILYVISLAIIIAGAFAILYTGSTREMTKNMLQADPKFLSILPFVLGVLLVLTGAAADHSWFIRLLGFLALLKGALIIANPQNLWTRLSGWYTSDASDQSYRFAGIVAIILGTTMVSWIR